jgi:hypothetical protein
MGWFVPVCPRDRDLFGAVSRGLDVIRKQMADLQAENARLKGEVKDLRAAVASLRAGASAKCP